MIYVMQQFNKYVTNVIILMYLVVYSIIKTYIPVIYLIYL